VISRSQQQHESGSDSSAPDGLPIVEELQPAPSAEDVFQCLSHRSHCLFLDSALRDPNLGRFSFIAVDPFDFIEFPVDDSEAISVLEQKLSQFVSASVPGLPPFQGGAAGLLSYDLNRSIERVPKPEFDEFKAPGLAIGFYDAVIAFDHTDNRTWIVSQGFPESAFELRRKRASERLQQVRRWITEPNKRQVRRPQDSVLDSGELAPQFAVGDIEGLTSNMSSDQYLAMVEKGVDYIHAGDVFQVNLAQRLLYPAKDHATQLYIRLREINPATFAGYFDLGEFQVVSASPERFVRIKNREVEARPIKGTRQRLRRPEADLFAGDDLLQSEKDRAENVMIVDLLRNDLSRICKPESVQVTDLCRLEMYQYVQHLVSVVRGELHRECKPDDLLRAAFPGGSITGAPKIRAMEIIAELEPTARGAYCGSLGYIGFDGAMDLSILIRTITAGKGWWQMPVGGGIVAQSEPQREYEETWHKAEGLLKALS